MSWTWSWRSAAVDGTLARLDPILIIKTGALGDVLRTTSILPGLRAAHPDARIEWVTAPAALDLVRPNGRVDGVHAVRPGSDEEVARLASELGGRHFAWVISLDDELPLCRLAAGLATDRLSGAWLDEDGARRYTADVAAWFDMGLLSVHGKERADRLKIENQRSHPAIYAEMLGIQAGEPELELPLECVERAAAFAGENELEARRPVVGLNTGSGGRWVSKQLPVERTVALARALHAELDGKVSFVLFGGPEEAERNAAIASALRAAGDALTLADAGTDNSLLDFAARVSLCDLLIASDSLALHIAIAQRVPVVAFFAPTSAAEIELYGRGEKVVSTAPDACSYRRDADNESLTPARLVAAAQRVLATTGC